MGIQSGQRKLIAFGIALLAYVSIAVAIIFGQEEPLAIKAPLIQSIGWVIIGALGLVLTGNVVAKWSPIAKAHSDLIIAKD